MLDDVQIKVVRRKRKTASIYIERDGTVTLYVPESLNENEINGIISDREYQIHKLLAKRELLNTSKIDRSPVNGESYLYLGRNYYLQYSDDVKNIDLQGKYLLVPRTSKDKLTELFRDFYRKQGQQYIPPRAVDFALKMGVKLEAVAILELKNRWASCSMKKAKINFHWKVMMAPVSIIEYLIIHELTHLKYRKHDSLFWNEVDKIMPDYQDKMEWLKSHGASLTI